MSVVKRFGRLVSSKEGGDAILVWWQLSGKRVGVGKE